MGGGEDSVREVSRGVAEGAEVREGRKIPIHMGLDEAE